MNVGRHSGRGISAGAVNNPPRVSTAFRWLRLLGRVALSLLSVTVVLAAVGMSSSCECVDQNSFTTGLFSTTSFEQDIKDEIGTRRILAASNFNKVGTPLDKTVWTGKTEDGLSTVMQQWRIEEVLVDEHGDVTSRRSATIWQIIESRPSPNGQPGLERSAMLDVTQNPYDSDHVWVTGFVYSANAERSKGVFVIQTISRDSGCVHS